MSTTHFDAIVIGGGLGGLLMANVLERSGRRVALLEALDAVGGNCRPQRGGDSFFDHGLKYFPNLPGSADALRWVESVTGLALEPELIDAPAVTYDGGRLQPFVGFGGEAPLTADEVSYYASPQHWRLRATPKDWVAALARGFGGLTSVRSQVTKIVTEGQRAVEVEVNGTKRLQADDVLYCAPPTSLLELIDADSVPTRARQRLQKGNALTSIHLDFVHASQITDSAAPHVLKGANEGPCVGLFHPTTLSRQLSQWCAFIPADQTDDSELISAQLKYVKRQIKRVYVGAFDGLVSERILVCPGSHGSADGLLTADGLWPKTKNLRPVSSLFSERRNLLGLLAECERVSRGLEAVQTPPPPNETDTACV